MTKRKDKNVDKSEKARRNKILLEKIIIGFIIINLMVFISVFADKCNSSVNRPAKLFLSSAATINIMYIFPIYKVFGWDNPIAKPFCVIRNYLYNEGMKRIPEDDGERELWWFVIRFTEYDRFILPKISKFFSIHDFTPSEKEFKKYEARTEELYNHIYPLGTLKIRDKHLISKRYNMFIATIDAYKSGEFFISYKKDQMSGKKTSPYNDFEIQKDKKLLYLILKQREYTKKYEPEGWDYYYNKTVNYYTDELHLFGLSHAIVINKLNKNELKCKDEYLNIYGESRKKLRNYIFDKKLPAAARNEINWASVGTSVEDKKIYNMCSTNTHLDLLKKDIDFNNPNSKMWEKVRKEEKEYYKKYKRHKYNTHGAVPLELIPRP